MTGRRAIAGWDARLSRALQFVPGHVGGRVASAQPIRRRGGTLRSPSVGAVAPPTVVVGSDAESNGAGATSTNVLILDMAPGDLVAVWGTFYGYTPDLSDWTTVESGTVNGRLTYVLAWRLADAALVSDGGFSLPLSGAGSGAHVLCATIRAPGPLRPAATVATAAGANSVAYADASGLLPWQFVGYRPNPAPVTATLADSPASNPDTEYTATLLTGGLVVGAVRGTLPYQSGMGTPGLHATTTDATSTAPGDWVSMGAGLT